MAFQFTMENTRSSVIPDETVVATTAMGASSVPTISAHDTDSAEKGLVPKKGVEVDVFDAPAAVVKYKTMSWLHTSALLLAEMISLGILTLPSAIAALGLVPGLILIAALGIIATYTAYVIWQFKMRYPRVVNMGDCGEVMFGAIGREVFAVASILVLIFVMSAHILTFTIAMTEITDHAICKVLWGLIGTALSLVLSLPRTLRNVAYISVVSFISITVAVVMTIVYLGVTRDGGKDLVAFVSPGTTKLPEALIAVLDVTIAYAGHVAFVTFISEMREPSTFPKALVLLQSVAISVYLLVATLIYYYVGPSVPSPALLATSPVVRKIAFGIAMPTILISGVIYGHAAAKYIYVRAFQRRKPQVITARSIQAYGSWVGILVFLWVLAWIVSEAVPNFNQLLALMAALLVTWFTFGVSSLFWFYMNKDQWFSSWKKSALTVVNLGILILGASICGLGLYGSGSEIHNDSSGKSFAC